MQEYTAFPIDHPDGTGSQSRGVSFRPTAWHLARHFDAAQATLA